MQTTVSQAILGYQSVFALVSHTPAELLLLSAIKLSKRSTWVTYTLVAAYLVACPVFGFHTYLDMKVLTTH